MISKSKKDAAISPHKGAPAAIRTGKKSGYTSCSEVPLLNSSPLGDWFLFCEVVSRAPLGHYRTSPIEVALLTLNITWNTQQPSFNTAKESHRPTDPQSCLVNSSSEVSTALEAKLLPQLVPTIVETH